LRGDHCQTKRKKDFFFLLKKKKNEEEEEERKKKTDIVAFGLNHGRVQLHMILK